jgi:hypothetical protein
MNELKDHWLKVRILGGKRYIFFISGISLYNRKNRSIIKATQEVAPCVVVMLTL